jgi:archaellum component FlaC
MEELLWKSRILEEQAQEHIEWQMITNQQLDSQIDRVSLTLARQKLTNDSLRQHIRELDAQIGDLSKLLEDDL